MSNVSGFNVTTRKAFASYLSSRMMRDIVVVYLIVLGALVLSMRDTQASVSPEAAVILALNAA
jgi:hypothetical protein